LSHASATTLTCSGLAIESGLVSPFDVKAELGGDQHSVAQGAEGLADEFLIHERSIHLSGVKKVTPRSTAARMSKIPCSFSTGGL